MTTPALHTITQKGRELLVQIAESQIAGEPMSDLVVDLRHMKSIDELVDLQPRFRTNGKPAIGRSLVINDAGRYVLAALRRADLSRQLRPLERAANDSKEN